MCILITEDAKKKTFVDQAKSAGMKDDESKVMANIMWKMMGAATTAQQKEILVRFNICDSIRFTCFVKLLFIKLGSFLTMQLLHTG